MHKCKLTFNSLASNLFSYRLNNLLFAYLSAHLDEWNAMHSSTLKRTLCEIVFVLVAFTRCCSLSSCGFSFCASKMSNNLFFFRRKIEFFANELMLVFVGGTRFLIKSNRSSVNLLSIVVGIWINWRISRFDAINVLMTKESQFNSICTRLDTGLNGSHFHLHFSL